MTERRRWHPRPAEPPPTEPTNDEWAALRAYLDTGSIRDAAVQLHVHEQTIKRRLANVRSRLGVETNAQAVLALSPQLRK